MTNNYYSPNPSQVQVGIKRDTTLNRVTTKRTDI